MIDQLKRLARGESLSFDDARVLMSLMLDGSAKLEQMGAMLALLHFRQPSAEILAGFASELGSHGINVEVKPELKARLVDVCGTGGDGSGTFNVSTTVAFLAASCGLPIAKHGNRAVSSLSGSFDVLEALGVRLVETASEASAQLDKNGLSFLFAPAFHPSFAKIAPVRKSLGFRTVFNAMGPMLNPAGVKRQLIGVYSADLVVPMAEALRMLGLQSAMIVHGDDGLDEISISAATLIAHLSGGEIRTSKFEPASIGIAPAPKGALAGGDAKSNAAIIEAILGGEVGPRADLACINTAAALVVGGLATDLGEGFKIATDVQRSGRALNVLRSAQNSSVQENS